MSRHSGKVAVVTGASKGIGTAILPGPVETEGTKALGNFEEFSAEFVPRTPLGRVGQPRDIASVVSFLASDQAGWITGQVIPVTVGLH